MTSSPDPKEACGGGTGAHRAGAPQDTHTGVFTQAAHSSASARQWLSALLLERPISTLTPTTVYALPAALLTLGRCWDGYSNQEQVASELDLSISHPQNPRTYWAHSTSQPRCWGLNQGLKHPQGEHSSTEPQPPAKLPRLASIFQSLCFSLLNS